MSRLAKGSATLVSLVTLVLASIIVWRVLPQQGPPISSGTLQVALLRCGLGAEALAAVGCSSQQIATVVDNARTELTNHPTRISEDDTAYTTARTAADALDRKIVSGQASQEEIASYQTATTTLEAAQSERQAALDAVFSAATQGLSQNQITLLQTIQANKARKLPIEFLTVNRQDSEWLGLRDALSNERISGKYGQEANGGMQATLSSARANQTVAAAKASIVANLATLTTAWNSATAGN